MSATAEQTTSLGVIIGGVLAIGGIGAYVLSDFASVTALIPTIFGALFVVLGAIGRDDSRQRFSVYGIGLLATLGVLGSLRGVPDILALLTGGSVDSVVAPATQALMIVGCVVLVGSVARYTLESR